MGSDATILNSQWLCGIAQIENTINESVQIGRKEGSTCIVVEEVKVGGGRSYEERGV